MLLYAHRPIGPNLRLPLAFDIQSPGAQKGGDADKENKTE
jgi:hypothetical protein